MRNIYTNVLFYYIDKYITSLTSLFLNIQVRKTIIILELKELVTNSKKNTLKTIPKGADTLVLIFNFSEYQICYNRK